MKMQRTHQGESALQIALPNDLRAWVQSHQMLAWIDEALASLPWEGAEMQAVMRQAPEFQPRRLLRWLAFAAATGDSSAEGLANLAQADPDLALSGSTRAVTDEELMAFREANSDLLSRLLFELMKRAIQHQLQRTLLPLPLKKYLAHVAALRIQEAGLADRERLAA